MARFKAGTICLNSTPDFATNLEKAERAVREAAKQGCDWVVLPEVFPFIGPDQDTYAVYERIALDVRQRFSSLAGELGIVLFAGTIPQPIKQEQRLLNTLFVFDRTGTELAHYHKTHLFELRDEHGAVKVTEKKNYLAGTETKTIIIDDFKVCLAICYDIRFLHFFTAQEQSRAIDVVVLPAAFTHETGSAHWELLLRARALDLQAFVIGAAQTGVHFAERRSFGHAMIVDPWARVIVDTGEAEGLVTAELDSDSIAASRARLPQRDNRRSDLYNSLS